MKSYIPENHTSATLAKEKIEDNIKKELTLKHMFGPYSEGEVGQVYEFFQTNPFGAVVNGDVLVQPINDLSFQQQEDGIPSVNSFVDADNFITTWDNFKKLSSFFSNLEFPVSF